MQFARGFIVVYAFSPALWRAAQHEPVAMYSEKNLAYSFDFGKNDVNKFFTIPRYRIYRYTKPNLGYPERTLLIIKRNGDLIIPKN